MKALSASVTFVLSEGGYALRARCHRGLETVTLEEVPEVLHGSIRSKKTLVSDDPTARILAAIESVRTELTTLRADMMARLDRLQDRFTTRGKPRWRTSGRPRWVSK
jgi:hypothetical protein